jgi:hypothetical protein
MVRRADGHHVLSIGQSKTIGNPGFCADKNGRYSRCRQTGENEPKRKYSRVIAVHDIPPAKFRPLAAIEPVWLRQGAGVVEFPSLSVLNRALFQLSSGLRLNSRQPAQMGSRR